MRRSSRSPFEIDDKDWDEYVEEMENVPLDFDDGSDKDHPQIFEEHGLVKVQNSKGEGITIRYDHYLEVMKKVGDLCPLCQRELGFSVTRSSRERKISVFRLWCERCDKTFEVIKGEICIADN